MRKKNTNSLGFTLLEMMIVVVIIAIILGLAVPPYLQSIRKGNRTEAKVTLNAMQLAEEKFRFGNVQYGNLAQIWGGITATPKGFYNLSISNLSSTSYTLTATGQGGQTNDVEGSTSCTTMSISVNNGVITKSPTECW